MASTLFINRMQMLKWFMHNQTFYNHTLATAGPGGGGLVYIFIFFPSQKTFKAEASKTQVYKANGSRCKTIYHQLKYVPEIKQISLIRTWIISIIRVFKMF